MSIVFCHLPIFEAVIVYTYRTKKSQAAVTSTACCRSLRRHWRFTLYLMNVTLPFVTALMTIPNSDLSLALNFATENAKMFCINLISRAVISYNMDWRVHINKRAISEVLCLNCQVLCSRKLVHDSYTADKHFLIYTSKQIISQIVNIKQAYNSQ